MSGCSLLCPIENLRLQISRTRAGLVEAVPLTHSKAA